MVLHLCRELIPMKNIPNRHRLAWLVLAAASLAAPCRAQSGVEVTTLRVQADGAGPRIDRNIFGQFAEHLGNGIYGGIWVGKESKIPNVRGVRSDVVAALKAIQVPNVRWPGGCFADEYHWRDGVGPAASRRMTINSNWGGAREPNTFGTDEFMDFIDQIGSEAYISVNVGSGTAAEAAQWLEYMTADPATSAGRERAANGHAAPYKVRMVGLGNESWGCGGSMRAEHYVDVMKPFSRYVRNYNPAQGGADAMQRIAVGPDGGKTEYTEAVMKAWKEHDWAWNIEGLSLHSYTVDGFPQHVPSMDFGEADYAKMIKETIGMETLIARHGAVMDQYDPDKKVGLYVDEWGIWLAPLPGTNPGFLVQQNSQRDAVLAALNLDIFARHADRVRGANIAQMINVLQAMILTDGPRMLLTPTYHVFRMYVPFHDATLVPVSFEAGTVRSGSLSLPRIDAIAARGRDGRLWLAVTNVDPNRAARIDVAIAGVHARGASGSVLTAPRVDSINTFEAPDTVAPRPLSVRSEDGSLHLTLPSKSVTVLAVDP